VEVRRLLDTNAVLYLLGGRLAESLEAGSYYVSVISEMELLSYPKLTKDATTQIRSFLAQVTVVELTKDVKNTAIQLRREHGLKLPDAIIAASAMNLQAELLTNDLELLGALPVRSRALTLKP
jgi:predicted nucleic acid-binding protein